MSHDPAPSEIYTLSLHDALPISAKDTKLPRFLLNRRKSAKSADCIFCLSSRRAQLQNARARGMNHWPSHLHRPRSRVLKLRDRKSTRLNSSHEWISYAVFCLKKK